MSLTRDSLKLSSLSAVLILLLYYGYIFFATLIKASPLDLVIGMWALAIYAVPLYLVFFAASFIVVFITSFFRKNYTIHKLKSYDKIMFCIAVVIVAIFLSIKVHSFMQARTIEQASSASADVLSQLYVEALDKNNKDLLEAIARNDQLPENIRKEILESALKENNMRIIQAVTTNKKTPAKDIEIVYNYLLNTDPALESSYSYGILTVITSHKSTSPQLLEKLSSIQLASQSHTKFLYRNIAGNPNTPAQVLQNLFNSRQLNYLGLVRISKNSNTPAKILLHLSQMNNPDIQMNVALNPNSPKEALKILANHQDERISSAAQKKLLE